MTNRQTPDARRDLAATDRDRRRAEALRANLRRRKTGRPDAERQTAETTATDGGREER